MSAEIVQASEIVTLIGPVEVSSEVLTESLSLGTHIFAVDGGADQALARGLRPEVVLGDFDSMSESARNELSSARFVHTENQHRTDFDKALSQLAAPLILAIGFTGKRLDHELAVYNALLANAGRAVVVVGAVDICFHLKGPLELQTEPGTRVSLFPMAEVACKSTGLLWPTDHLNFAPWGRVGTSNEAAAESFTLTPSGPGMLVILPRAMLAQVAAALTLSR